jgi:peptide/nickel transport system substrate-binding protein
MKGRFSFWLIGSTFVLALCLLWSGCSTKKADTGKTVFRYNDATGITNLDPAFSRDQSHNWVCQQLYNGLVELDSNLIVRPSIASNWSISDDLTTYLFTLRKDVYFTENKLFINSNKSRLSARLVTAKDMVFSLQRLVDPELASPGSWVMNSVVKAADGQLTGVRALNDSTVEIQLNGPNPAFLSLLAMPYCSVVPQEVVRYYGNEFGRNPCGTGPFKLAFWKENVRLILHRNEHYFEVLNGQSLPFLDAVEISFINDKQSAFIEFLKGNLDLLSGLDPSYKDELLTASGELQPRHRGKFRLQTLPYLNTEYLGIVVDTQAASTTNSPLRIPAVRQALSYGFDRASMMLYLRNNMATPGIYGFVPPGLPSFLADTSIGYSYNPDKSLELLKEAGFPNGKGLPEIVLSTTSSYLDLCEFIKSQWEAIGINVKIDVNQAAVHRKMVAEQKLTFFRGSWIADYPDAENYLSLFYSSNAAPAGPNYTHYSNPEFDRLFQTALRAANDSERFALYRQMDAIVMHEAPVIVLYYDKVVRLTGKNISGLPVNAMNNLLLKYVRKSSDL